MYGIHFSAECVQASSVNMFNNRNDKYLVYNSMSRLSISKWLPCLLPSEVFLGWQSC